MQLLHLVLELNLLVQQAVPVRRGKLWAIVQLENMTNQRVGEFAYISFDNRWIISGRQNPIRLTVAGRYEF